AAPEGPEHFKGERGQAPRAGRLPVPARDHHRPGVYGHPGAEGPAGAEISETKKRTPPSPLRGVRLSYNQVYSAAATSWTSTGALPGRVARPMAARAPTPASPSCSYSQPETISPTLAWVV